MAEPQLLKREDVARELRQLAGRIDPADETLDLVRKHLASFAECVEHDPPLVHEAYGQTFLG